MKRALLKYYSLVAIPLALSIMPFNTSISIVQNVRAEESIKETKHEEVKTLEEYVSQFEYWDEIQSKEVDTAFEAYLRGPYITKLAKNEADRVFELMKDGKLLGIAAEAHEKWEVLEYLKKGYTLEEISNGVAHKNYKPYAHAEARFKEYKLYQFLYQKQFDKESPPIQAYFLVQPFLEIFLEDVYNLEVKPEHLEYLLSEFREREASIRSEACSEKDLENALKFFEKNGYQYKDRSKMLQRAIEFLTSKLEK